MDGKKKKQNLGSCTIITKISNIQDTRVRKGQEREDEAKRIPEEIMAENFLNLEKDINIYSNSMNLKTG